MKTSYLRTPLRDSEHDTTEDDGLDRPSKTQLKQAMHELQALGMQLVELSPGHLKTLQLPEDLYRAVSDCQRFPQREARRRQLQYIGKLMRSLDPAPIISGLEALRGESAAEIAQMHRLEDLRTRFLADEKVLDEILARSPFADITLLRQMRRNALKEQAQSKPPKAFRLLFKTLKALENNPSETTLEEENP